MCFSFVTSNRLIRLQFGIEKKGGEKRICLWKIVNKLDYAICKSDDDDNVERKSLWTAIMYQITFNKWIKLRCYQWRKTRQGDKGPNKLHWNLMKNRNNGRKQQKLDLIVHEIWITHDKISHCTELSICFERGKRRTVHTFYQRLSSKNYEVNIAFHFNLLFTTFAAVIPCMIRVRVSKMRIVSESYLVFFLLRLIKHLD